LVVIGIDFSIQFPAVCICKDFKSFRWIACVNSNTTKAHRKLLEDTQLEFPELEFIFLPPKNFKYDTYSGVERAKLANYSLLVDTLINRVEEVIKDEPNRIISIEGIAYGAQGNALIDIAQSTGMLRKKVLDNLLNNNQESLFIFSPGELKNAIGAKGNAGKFDVYKQFKETPMLAKDSSLHKVLLKYEEQIVKKEVIGSPYMDMIDSYLAVLKIHTSLKES
jgi:Holliday junction resolvasome RuvABC endonuclease subunit